MTIPLPFSGKGDYLWYKLCHWTALQEPDQFRGYRQGGFYCLVIKHAKYESWIWIVATGRQANYPKAAEPLPYGQFVSLLATRVTQTGGANFIVGLS